MNQDMWHYLDDTAKQTLDALVVAYGTPGAAGVFVDFQSLIHWKMTNNEDPSIQINKLQTIIDRLNSNNLILPASVLAMTVLAALPSAWDGLASTILATTTLANLTIPSILPKILKEYHRRGASQSSNAANTSRQSLNHNPRSPRWHGHGGSNSTGRGRPTQPRGSFRGRGRIPYQNPHQNPANQQQDNSYQPRGSFNPRGGRGGNWERNQQNRLNKKKKRAQLVGEAGPSNQTSVYFANIAEADEKKSEYGDSDSGEENQRMPILPFPKPISDEQRYVSQQVINAHWECLDYQHQLKAESKDKGKQREETPLESSDKENEGTSTFNDLSQCPEHIQHLLQKGAETIANGGKPLAQRIWIPLKERIGTLDEPISPEIQKSPDYKTNFPENSDDSHMSMNDYQYSELSKARYFKTTSELLADPNFKAQMEIDTKGKPHWFSREDYENMDQGDTTGYVPKTVRNTKSKKRDQEDLAEYKRWENAGRAQDPKTMFDNESIVSLGDERLGPGDYYNEDFTMDEYDG
ncbi:hypothetical protein M378DRAFT_16269 [Amanita muscaria Koide BX008]|uniref:Uncharacterized protein n=1 Tax=Amanita muscaria (strain Koide BX008) TaxID=946122 RepID=A0A0C2WL39_AMAMK|nr:hypothetical protein M378DRAFT_16269 [Amanita muscaria Koide BX008]